MSEPLSNEVTLRTFARPADANPNGDIFGGWLLSQMDMAGGSAAAQRAGGRVVTVAMDAIVFLKPVEIGDELSCYTSIRRVGTTSITVDVSAWKRNPGAHERVKVTEGVFTFVKIDENRRPMPVAQQT